MKSRFSEEQIINILNESKTGVLVEELCRRYNISKAILYKFSGKGTKFFS